MRLRGLVALLSLLLVAHLRTSRRKGSHNEKSHGTVAGFGADGPKARRKRAAEKGRKLVGDKTSASEPLRGKKAEEQAERDFADWRDSLSEDEREALVDYQGDAYEPVNQYLRGASVLGGDDELIDPTDLMGEAEIKAITGKLDSAIDKGRLKKPVVSHRYFRYEGAQELLDNFDNLRGATIADPGYHSTTLDSGYARQRAQITSGKGLDPQMQQYMKEQGLAGDATVLAEIHVPAGAKAAYYDGWFHEGFSREKELLLPRGTKYRVTDTGKNEDGIPTVVLEVI